MTMDLFPRYTPPIRTAFADDAVNELLAKNAPVAISVSGGKDSCALALATIDYLDYICHAGQRILIHADLGMVEWEDSLPTCQRLAEATGLELVVVKRGAGGMMERWESRWDANVKRYQELSCVKLILPWSTPSMRFCTSELKVAVITSYLKKRFPGKVVVSANGIRRQESDGRKNAPVSKPQPKLATAAGLGLDWHAIAHWSEDDVWAIAKRKSFQMHEAYTRYHSSRVSCVFCIMGKASDLKASAECEAHAPVYQRMVKLELISGYGFQSGTWLCDVAPHLLSQEIRELIPKAKERAKIRETYEAIIPTHLLFKKGWPEAMPTWAESCMLASVRLCVGSLYGFQMQCVTPERVSARYEELLEEKARKKK